MSDRFMMFLGNVVYGTIYVTYYTYQIFKLKIKNYFWR